MASINAYNSINDFQNFAKKVYETPNNRNFETGEMLDQIQRFATRGLKGIRKKDFEKAKKNFVISLSFFASLLNRFEIDLESEVWKRFPYVCSYCNSLPCSCRETKPERRIEVFRDESKKPGSIAGFQKMFSEIYPPVSRTIEHAGIHLAEELGEFSEAIWTYRSSRDKRDFTEICIEAADFFSCIIGVFNSLNINLAEELSQMYSNNCHTCNKTPCECSYEVIRNFRS